MEGEVAAKVRMKHGKMLPLCFISWIDGLHTHVEPQDKKVEVQAQSQSVGHGYLLIKLV